MQWFKHPSIKEGEEIIPLPTSFSSTNFICLRNIQAWNDNKTVNTMIYATPVANNTIKTYGYNGYENFFFAIGT